MSTLYCIIVQALCSNRAKISSLTHILWHKVYVVVVCVCKQVVFQSWEYVWMAALVLAVTKTVFSQQIL